MKTFPLLPLAALLALLSLPSLPTPAQSTDPARPRIIYPPTPPPPSPQRIVRPTQAPAPVVWSASTRTLSQHTSIEVRFPTTMVHSWGDSISFTDAEPEYPITVAPPLAGKWTWRSAESGVFVPTASPDRGQSYTISLRQGLTDATGRPLPAPQPSLTLAAAGLQLVDWHPRWTRASDAPRQQPVILQFNDAVDPTHAATQLTFTNSAGHQQRATVRLATFSDLENESVLAGIGRQRALTLAGVDNDAPTPAPDLVLPATLVVTPADPLPTGKDWKLTVQNIRTADRKHRLDETKIVSLGNIDALMVGYHAAENHLGQPKSIVLRFNKPLASTHSADDVVARVKLQPAPPDLKHSFDHGVVRLTGSFDHHFRYLLTIEPGLTSRDGLVMPTAFHQEFTFQPITPVVALPAFSANQLASGHSTIPIQAVNISEIKVRIKVADRDSLIYALRAYRQYRHPDSGEDASKNAYGPARIAFDAMPGQKVFEQSFPSSAPLDTLESFTVDWRSIMQGHASRAYFIAVEGTAREQWLGKARHFGAQAFVQLTDLGLAYKLSDSDVFVSLFSLATGQPLPDVAITAYDPEKNLLSRITTAADGTARFARQNIGWLLAETEEDVHAVDLGGPNSGTLGMWRFGIPYDWEPVSGLQRQMSFFTDRPLYQPGQTVHFKAISRLIDDTRLRHPDDPETAVLKVYDAESRLVHQRDLTFSSSGAVDGTLTLPTSPLGRYSLRIELPRLGGVVSASENQDRDDADEEDPSLVDMIEEEFGYSQDLAVFRTSILVEEYRPNTFQIAFDTDAFTLNNEQASLPLSARYLLGKPLAMAKVNWSAQVATLPFKSDAYPEHRFLDSTDNYYFDSNGYHDAPSAEADPALTTAQARTDLSDDGRATLEFPVLATATVATPRQLNVTAEITDLNEQTITERWRHPLHSSDFYLGISRLHNVVSAHEPVDIALAAARSDGQPWPESVDARVTVEKIDFVTVRLESVGGGSNLRTEAERRLIADGNVRVTPDRHQSAPFQWTPKEPGFYHITAHATDPAGRPVRSVTSINVHGSGWASWLGLESVQIDLTPDQPAYHGGETARILVKSPVAGRALVTLERRHVIRHFFTDITSNSQVIEIPIDRDLAPNVFVSVMIVRGAESSPRQHRSTDYTVGFTQLRVMDDHSRLAVAVAAGQPAYRPGDQGAVTAIVSTASGAPVAGAEVTLWAVDDGVLSLVPYQAPDVWSLFHRPQPLAVETGTSLADLLPEDPRELAFTNKGYMIGGGDDDSGGSHDRLRHNFQPLAFFHGSLVTDATGRITVPFTVPDNLTRFRLIAVATSGTDAFGTGEGHFVVNKPLMLTPATPRFANVGDRVSVKAVVLNHTDQAFDAEVSLTLDPHARSSEPLVRRVPMQPHGTAAVTFPLTFEQAGTAAWQWQVVSKTPGITLQDTVESTLPVGYAQPILREMHYAILTPESPSIDLLARANPELVAGHGSVTITLSNSIILEATGALNYLLQYPYGCAEQTTSTMLPWLAAHQFGPAIPGLKNSPEDVRSAIQFGVNNLLTMQSPNGGFGYWPGQHLQNLWISNYVGMGLALAHQAGASIPPPRLHQLAHHLSEALRGTAEDTDASTLHERAFACYVLALLGKAEPSYHEILARKVDILTPKSRGLLALAMFHAGASRDAALAVLDVPADDSEPAPLHPVFHSHLHAIELLAWSKVAPTHARTASLVDQLLRERQQEGRWNSTYTNAWALLALASLLENHAIPQPSSIEVTFAGQSTTLELPAHAASRSLTLPFSGQPSERKLVVRSSSAGSIRIAAEINARPVISPVQPRSHGLTINRRYHRVEPNGHLSPADNLEVGDLVAVTLDLDIPRHLEYLAVDDPLPSILEAINPKFTSQAPDVKLEPGRVRHPWWSTHQELRTDRALFFADYTRSAGAYQINYLARVIAEGEVTAPAAKIEMMYNPAQYGLSGTQKLSARAGKDPVAGTK